MESIKKYWIWGIFISILSIFAMSHNAAALTTTLDLSGYEITDSIATAFTDCEFINGTILVYDHVVNCQATIQNTTMLKSIITEQTFNTKKGDIVNFYLLIWSDSTSFNYLPRFVDFTTTGLGWDLIDYHEVMRDDYFNDILSYNGHINEQGNNYDITIDFYHANGFYRIYDISMRARNDGAKNIGLTSSGGLFRFNANDIGNTVSFSMRNYRIYRYVGSSINKEQEEKTQEAVDDSEAAGGSSSQDAQTGTTGLLNAITGAVSVISSASPTNCKINGNMGNLDIGQLDLCANPAPTFIQTIGSLILILMCVPLAISLFNRFIAIFRSFQS